MLALALDTTTRPGSIALIRDAELVASASGDAEKTHAERLPAAVVSLLSRAGLALSAIDVFGVAAGPGSFTGLRIGIATVQGLAFALGRPVVGVSCLDVLAFVAAEAASGCAERPLVGAWMDAQRSEVFAELYAAAPGRPGAVDEVPRRPAEGKGWAPDPWPPNLGVLDGPTSGRPAAVLERWQPLVADRPVWVAGDGVSRYRALLVEHIGDRLHTVEPLPPLAPLIGRLALTAAAEGRAVPPHAIRPIYVRRPDAELARHRQQDALPTESRRAE